MPLLTIARGTIPNTSSSSERHIRSIDLTLALFACALAMPVMLVIALLVALQDGGPVFFAHRRYGRRGRTFLCYKFRTMAVDADQRLARLLASDDQARAEWELDHKLRRDPRVTRLGSILRKTSLDELPQLFNVLGGTMSFVGPRPIVAAEVARYGHKFRNYCSVRPGITGLWQVSGRNDVSYRRRVAMDCVTTRRMRPAFYLRVMASTAVVVATGRGAY